MDKDAIVNKKNWLKASLAKITKEDLTPDFLTDLVALSKSASYLTSIDTDDFVNNVFP